MLRTLLVSMLLLAIAGAPAMARPQRQRPTPGADDAQARQRRPGGDRRAAKRDKVKNRIRIMRAMVLTEQLQLDEATAGKMFPILGRYDDELAKLLGERATLRAKLAVLRKGGKAAEINGVLDLLIANQRARWTAEEKRFADLRALLTPEQAATLLDVLPEVDRKILRGLRDAVTDDVGGELGGNPFNNRK